MLFHDIKPVTARALPSILDYLKKNGYKVVHLRPKAPLTVKPDYDQELSKLLGKSVPTQAQSDNASASDETGDGAATSQVANASATARADALPGIPVTKVAPPLRERSPVSLKAHRAGPPTSKPSASGVYKRRSGKSAPKRRYRYQRRPARPPSSFWF